MSETTRFAIFHVWAENYEGRYKDELVLPLNLCNVRDNLARSLFLTLYKQYSAFIFTSSVSLNSNSLDKHEKVFDIIDDCQTIFFNSIKNIPCGVYVIEDTWLVADNLTFVGRNSFKTVDKLYIREEQKDVIKEKLEKAAIIVEGFLQYLGEGKFTEECLALVDDYRATKMLEG